MLSLLILVLSLGTVYVVQNIQSQNNKISSLDYLYDQTKSDLESQIQTNQNLLATDYVKQNQEIKLLYTDLSAVYEALTDLRYQNTKTVDFDKRLATIFNLIGKLNYASASGQLKTLSVDIKKKTDEIAALPKIAANVPIQNSAPTNSGYNRQAVEVDGVKYLVDVITADLKTTKVVVDTASPADCRNDCPVDSLAAFAARSGAFAAINGPYFCPASYPACADKKNSFDTLLMNKNKTYFNSDNNVYSSVPAAIFSTSSRFVEKSMDWGRDTSVDSVIAGQPLLVMNGQSRFGGDGDPKKTGKGSRSFIGATDNLVYIGIVRNASVAEAANVLAKMGIKNALNLDSGGSTALWSNGKYLAGPGRDTPFGILFVRR